MKRLLLMKLIIGLLKLFSIEQSFCNKAYPTISASTSLASGKIKKQKPHHKKNYHYVPRFPSSFAKNLFIHLKSNKQTVEYGICTYYHYLFHRRKTATGDIFDQWQWTAAHRTLPIPCIILICYLDEKRRLKGAIVLVNDRGPYVNARVLDVSYSLAQEMNFINKGKIKVAIFFLKKETLRLALNKNYKPKHSGILDAKQIMEILKENNIQIYG